MATVDLSAASTKVTHASKQTNVKQGYLMEMELNLATAATTKGSALAAADVIKCIRIPAGTAVVFAGLSVKTAQSGGSADQSVGLGDSGSTSRWVAAFDLDAAVAGDYAPLVVASTNPTVFATTSTVDLIITGATTVGTAGLIRIFAYMVDLSDSNAPGIAPLKS